MGTMYFDVWDADDINGTALGHLSEATDKHIRKADNAFGEGQFTINRHSSQFDWCATDNVIRVRLEAGGPFDYDDPRYVYSFMIEEGEARFVQTNEQGGEDVTLNGRDTYVCLLKRAIIYPDAHYLPGDPEGNDIYWARARKDGLVRINAANFAQGGRSVGTVFRIFFRDQESKSPNPLSPLNDDMTYELDSDGNTWTETTTDWEFPVGMDMLEVLERCVSAGFYHECGADLILHGWDEQQGDDVSGTVSFVHGVNIATSADKTIHGSPAVSRALVQGATDDSNMRYREVIDAGVEAELGRREEFIEYGLSPTNARLDLAGRKYIDTQKSQHDGPTTITVIDTAGKTAFVDYFPGDTVAVDIPDAWTGDFRISAISLDDIANGEYDPTINFLEQPWDGAEAGEPKAAGNCRDCPPLGPYVPDPVEIYEPAPGVAIEYRPTIQNTAGDVEFTSDGDNPVSGDVPHAIPDGISYIGSVSNRTGFLIEQAGRVDVRYQCEATLATFSSSTLHSTLFLNGAVIGDDVNTIPPSGFRLHETIITVTDLLVAAGDEITVRSEFENPTGTPALPSTSGGGNNDLRITDIEWLVVTGVTPPIPGQQGNEQIDGTTASTTYTTNFPYVPGSLQVILVCGSSSTMVVPDETNPAAGEFELTADATGCYVVVRYIIASATGTGETNPPPTAGGGLGGGVIAASSVTVADGADWFDMGTDDVEAALAELAAKTIGVDGTHGNLGSTETFDAAIGWHSGTLNANCTFTLVGAPSGTASSLFLELAQDGTGGWTITLPASVVNKADIEAEQDTTASETTFLVLVSRDGGTSWYGGWWGSDGGGPGGGGVDVEDEGTPLSTTATTLNFTGAGVTATGSGTTKTINITSGTGPGTELDYVQITSNASITATLEASAQVVITGNSVSYDGSTTVMVHFFTDSAQVQGTTGVNFVAWLFEDGSSIGLISRVTNNAGAQLRVPMAGWRRLTPSAGSHTYSIRATTTSGTSIVLANTGGAGTEAPAFMRITAV